MTTDAVGGVWTYSAALAQALAREGYCIHLVILGPAPRQDQLAPLQGAAGINVEVTDLALEWMDPHGSDLPRARDALRAIAQRVKPDVVHLNGFREATAQWPAPVLVVAHSCVRSWSHACHGEEPREPQWRQYIANVALGLAAADQWVAPTAAFRDTIWVLYGAPAAGAVIWNGTDAIPRSPLKQPFICAAGRLWDEAKNLSALAQAAQEIIWPIHVAGAVESGENKAQIAPARAEQLQLLGTVPHAELISLMRRAAIFAAPALYEPFGLAVLEAASAGCALALSDIASFRELWDGAALFFDPHDVNTIRDSLNRLCTDAELRTGLQAAAIARARRYSTRRMVQNYSHLYRTICAGHAAIASEAPHPSAAAEVAA